MNLHIQPIQIKQSDDTITVQIHAIFTNISLKQYSNVTSCLELYNGFMYDCADTKFDKFISYLHNMFDEIIVGRDVETFLTDNSVSFEICVILDIENELNILPICNKIEKYLLENLNND